MSRDADFILHALSVIGIIFVLLFIAGGAHCQTSTTRVRQLPDKTILRRGNFIIAATTDGYLCYGTHDPLETTCHRAVPAPEWRYEIDGN